MVSFAGDLAHATKSDDARGSRVENTSQPDVTNRNRHLLSKFTINFKTSELLETQNNFKLHFEFSALTKNRKSILRKLSDNEIQNRNKNISEIEKRFSKSESEIEI